MCRSPSWRRLHGIPVSISGIPSTLSPVLSAEYPQGSAVRKTGGTSVGQAPAVLTLTPHTYGKEPSPGIEIQNPEDIPQEEKFRLFAVHGRGEFQVRADERRAGGPGGGTLPRCT